MANPKHVIALLQELAARTKQSLDFTGFGRMAEELENHRKTQPEKSEKVTRRYLYDNAFRQSLKSIDGEKESLRLSAAKLDSIATFLDYPSYFEFERRKDTQEEGPNGGNDADWDPYIGIWYSIIREHTQKPYLLISPVEIKMENHVPRMILRGPSRILEGTAFMQNQCLCAHLFSDLRKHINLIFSIGAHLKPDILEGVFSAVASSGNPIAGREVLFRVPHVRSMDDLENLRIHLDELEKLPSEISHVVGKYFQLYEKNIIKIPSPNTFGPEDLDR